MSGNNAYLKRQAADRQVFMDATSRVTRQMMVDTLILAANEQLGLGYERLDQLIYRWAEIYNHYWDACSKNVEADVLREHLDRALLDIVKGRDFYPFEERYPDVNKITYEGRNHHGGK